CAPCWRSGLVLRPSRSLPEYLVTVVARTGGLLRSLPDLLGVAAARRHGEVRRRLAQGARPAPPVLGVLVALLLLGAQRARRVRAARHLVRRQPRPVGLLGEFVFLRGAAREPVDARVDAVEVAVVRLRPYAQPAAPARLEQRHH